MEAVVVENIGERLAFMLKFTEILQNLFGDRTEVLQRQFLLLGRHLYGLDLVFAVGSGKWGVERVRAHGQLVLRFMNLATILSVANYCALGCVESPGYFK